MNSRLNVKENNFVTQVKDLEKIVYAVSARMDEPGLKGKVLVKILLPELQMLRLLKELDKKGDFIESITRKHYSEIDASYIQDKDAAHLFYVLIKQDSLGEVIKSYFHEAGHIANLEFKQKSRLPRKGRIVLEEALATSFAYWALDEFNQVNDGLKYPGSFSHLIKQVELQSKPEKLSKSTPEIRAMFRFLFALYHQFATAKDIYARLKFIAHTPGVNARLCERLEKEYIGK